MAPHPRRLALLVVLLLCGGCTAASAPPLLKRPAALVGVTQTSCFNAEGAACACSPKCQLCGPAFGRNTPQFHIADATCGENDPNFPLYDARHSLYHHFWQAHLAEDQNGVGQGPDIGHAVSADMVTWAHLPIAVWNDAPYDNVAIYTGSATIVNGIPTMVYPGLCTKRDWANCSTGTLLAVAIPDDHANDPLLTNWVKPSYNPIVENTQRDPSTAWQTASGEWRMTNYEGKVWTSPDFVKWSVASAVLFAQAECPDFHPLPGLCAGNGCANGSAHALQPTHVHTESSGSQDWYTLGVYTDGANGSAGTWTPLAGVPRLQPLDFSTGGSGMHFYASKSFLDPRGGRRIYYGWAVVRPASTQTLARVTNYHAGLQRLTFAPLPELASLRALPPLFAGEPDRVSLPPGVTRWLGDWSAGAGNQSEVAASFVLPATGGRSSFGLAVVVGAPAGGGDNVSTPILIHFDRASFTANVSVGGAPPRNLSYYMPGVDLGGDDYSVVNVNYTDPRICQAACTADGEKCQAFTYVTRPPLVGSCCLKGSVPAPGANPTCTSGSKHGGRVPGSGGAFASIPLLSGDSAIDVRVFTDNTFIEVFVMEGRLAFTYDINVGAEAGAAGVTLYADAANGATVVVRNASVWHLNDIWTSTGEVLAAARGSGDGRTGGVV